ncbi:MAG: F0F1 ATP synthase subunit epsilon [Coxiellaceae bacterium]|nr:F0F1 ATP synthase subunit epsilon [Coxiellaceae bacterium]
MSTKTMGLDIVSAESQVFSGTTSKIEMTGGMGELGIFPGHTALLTSIKPGQVRATLDSGEEEVFYINGGMLEVQPDMVTILADTAARAEDLDEAAAVAAKEQAEKALEDKRSELEYSKAVAELAEAVAQIRAIQAIRKKVK